MNRFSKILLNCLVLGVPVHVLTLSTVNGFVGMFYERDIDWNAWQSHLQLLPADLALGAFFYWIILGEHHD